MVRETSVNEHDGPFHDADAAPHPRQMAEKLMKSLRIALRLLQLQIRLFTLDSAATIRDSVSLLVILLAGTVLAMIATIGFVFGLAHWISMVSLFSLGAILMIEGAVIAAFAALLVVWGVRRAKRLGRTFERTSHEFQNNVTWLSKMIHRST